MEDSPLSFRGYQSTRGLRNALAYCWHDGLSLIIWSVALSILSGLSGVRLAACPLPIRASI
jgi:hypothetical protein